MFPSGFQCHRAALQSIGEGSFWSSFGFDSFRYSRDIWGGCQRLRWFLFAWAHTMVLRIGAALAASFFETVVCSPLPENGEERKKSRNHTAATGKAVHSVAISLKSDFLSPPFPRPPPLGRESQELISHVLLGNLSFWIVH